MVSLFALRHKAAASGLIPGKKTPWGRDSDFFTLNHFPPIILSIFEQVLWVCSPHNPSSGRSGCELVFLGRGYVLAMQREMVGISAGLIGGLTKLATIKILTFLSDEGIKI